MPHYGQDYYSLDSMTTGSKKAVYTALLSNLGIAIAKFIATILTGSIAMLVETLHSLSDTFNQVLLLIGIKTSAKAATERHPFGYGKEQFFLVFYRKKCSLEYQESFQCNKVLVH